MELLAVSEWDSALLQTKYLRLLIFSVHFDEYFGNFSSTICSSENKQTTQQPQEVLASVFQLPVVLSNAIIDVAQVYHCA